MSKHKPFRFSLQSFNTDSPASWRALIAKTEALGYSTFFLADHFLSAGPALDVDNFAGSNTAVEKITLGAMERNHIVQVLEQTGWRVSGRSGAATLLGLNESTLRARMGKLGIKRPG